jgi:epoxyqueuosine reductase
MKDAIRQRARELGFDDCRFTTADPPSSGPFFRQWLAQEYHGQMGYLERNAHKRIAPEQILSGAKTILTLAASYATSERPVSKLHPRSRTTNQGIIARYARHADYHHVIGERLKQLTQFISSLAGPDTRSLWYIDTGPLLERDLAQRAGLGFIGKHTNLISRKLGNWILLSEILTTVQVEPDSPEKNLCGTCSRCITACPTAAIKAPFQLDARLCISYLTIELKGPMPVELRPLVGNRIFGCDDCLAVCPWNRFAREGQIMKSYARPELATPDLLDLLALDEIEFKRRFAGTPIMRAKCSGLLRNVCVALGNVGDQSALPALEKAAKETEPLLAEHAKWAVEQIQQRTVSNCAHRSGRHNSRCD